MMFGLESTFAVEIDLAAPTRSDRPREWGRPSFWVAGIRFGWRDADPDWMPPLADFFDLIVRDGQSHRSDDLVALPDPALVMQVMSKAYLSDSDAECRRYRTHLLAPNGSCAFDPCALVCVDWHGHSRIVGMNSDWNPELSLDDLPEDSIIAARVPTETKNSVLTAATSWLRDA